MTGLLWTAILSSTCAIIACCHSWLVPLLIRSACRWYKSDPSAPSLTISWIRSQDRWYASVCRYTEAYGKGKVVVHNTYNTFFHLALCHLAVLWFTAPAKPIPAKAKPVTRHRNINSMEPDFDPYVLERKS